MSTPIKLVGFLAAVAAIFGIAVGIGRAVGPVADEVTAHDTHASGATDREGPEPSAEPASSAQIPGGLMVSQNGYTLSLGSERTLPGKDRPVDFTITGPNGTAVTEYHTEHEKKLHLIAVRRDFSGFQHVHPTLGDDGVWTTNLDLTPGTWRIFADFKATGADALTLGTDLAVTGDFEPVEPMTENRTATVDEYKVTLDGELAAGGDAKLTLSIAKDGEPVTDLQPYLGAYGHLVALRGGDLAYLHVHPDGTPGDGSTEPGPDAVFYAAVPSAGTYHLYLDFQHAGVVRTASFTVTAGETGAAPSNSREPAANDGHSGH